MRAVDDLGLCHIPCVKVGLGIMPESPTLVKNGLSTIEWNGDDGDAAEDGRVSMSVSKRIVSVTGLVSPRPQTPPV